MKPPEYWAGYFDADGSIGWQQGGAGAVVSITSTYRPLIYLALTELGGWVQYREGSGEGKARHRNAWVWKATGKTARSFLKTVHPLLEVKRLQAVQALTLLEYPPGPERLEVVAQLKALKWREWDPI